MKLFLHGFLRYAAVAAGIAVLLLLVARGLRPDVSTPPPPPPPDVVAAVEASRHVTLDRAHPPVLVRDVNYAAGTSSAWWPRHESPIFADLEREGKLPPLAARVGPEPLVMEGGDGVGRYGGTWYRLANSERDVLTTQSLLMTPTLMRWSPQGYPVVPYVAKSLDVSPDQREFTFTLRRGMKWSDGAPFTADDILFWWQEEVLYFKQTPRFMRIAGQMGTVEKIDDLHVRFRFPLPNPYFPTCVARTADQFDVLVPAHYLRQFHPAVGDQALIRRMMIALKLATPAAVYRRMKEWRNPECPRLSPWIYRTYKPSAPYTFVRNPYFFAVDPQGHQLPYLDRVVIDVKTPPLIPVSASNGELSMQDRHIFYDNHTLLLGGMKRGGYHVLHWFAATRSVFTIYPVLNRRVDPKRPATANKAALLNDRRFRQALSLAINRRAIIDAVFNGQGEPAQLDGGPLSDFHSPELFHSFTAFDPARANQLLDELGLTGRDREGFRTFADGSRMTFYLYFMPITTQEPAQFVIDDWARVGVRTILRIEGRPLFYAQKAAYEHDFDVWIGNTEFDPLLDPRNFVPTFGETFFAPGYGLWYRYGGLYGDPAVKAIKGAIAPPPGGPIRREMELLDQAYTATSRTDAIKDFRAIQHIAAENVWSISIATAPPQLVVVKDGLRNVPDHAISGTPYMTPLNTGVETYFWDNPSDGPATIAQIKHEIARVVPMPNAGPVARPATAAHSGATLAALVRWLILGALGAGLLLAGFRHPLIGRRLLLMIPTLVIISLLVFTVIQLPPGDFITAKMQEIELTGDASASAQIEDLRAGFHLDESPVKQYCRWVGLVWFTTFDARDAGLLQGNLGRSMEYNRPVNDLVGDRILLTLAVSGFTILFTWAVALPTGIFAAVRQYSFGDYVLTFLGFVGMSVPAFLAALVLIFLSQRWFGIEVTGLFSARYATQTGWTWGRFGDLLQHIWVPVLVLGLAGTAGMIRVMRANLLDELRKPYVTAARARGCRPIRLLVKYPVRIALNPFVSGLGTLFPHLISGGAIIAMVLSLPIIGPDLVSALLNQDTYFAGSLLIVLSLLGVFGTLLSDLLLLWFDPRIRLGGGKR